MATESIPAVTARWDDNHVVCECGERMDSVIGWAEVGAEISRRHLYWLCPNQHASATLPLPQNLRMQL